MSLSGRQLLLQFVALFALLAQAPNASAASVLADGTVRFEVGSSNLTAESVQVLDRLAGLLKRRPDLEPIELVGHADTRGAESTNRALSKGRADTVRRALISRGIRPTRLKIRGAGSAEPISKAGDEAARRLNRRVEVWVTPQRPVAEVTRVRREVLSKEAAAVKWRGARLGQPLRRLARVRTEKASASEVTFQSKDRVQLGPQALVVIHDSPRRTRRAKSEVADVRVEQGTIFAAMAAKDRTLEVETPPARISVRSKRTRVDVRSHRAKRSKRAKKKKKVSTVSVFEGRTEVAAQGHSVVVKEGFGTRVKEGERPEPPRPLPLAPTWSTRNPVVGFEGQPIHLAWRRAPGVAEVEVQLGLHDDPAVDLPHQLWRVKGDETHGGKAQVGLYHLRLVGVDDRDISGAPGPSLKLLSLPLPTDGAGKALRVSGRRIRLPTPGLIQFPKLQMGTLSSTTSSAALAVTLIRSGLHALPFTAKVAGVKVQDELHVWVDTATLTAKIEQGESTSITFEVRTAAGSVEGLQWVAGVVPESTPRLAADPGDAVPLVDCRCSAPPEHSKVEALGAGRYRWVLSSSQAILTSSVTVRLYEARGRMATELTVPVNRVADGPGIAGGPSVTHGWFAGLRLGILVDHADAPSAQFSGELGYRWAMGRGLELDLSVEAGGFGRSIQGQDVKAFPVLARAAFGLDLGAPHVYAGAGAGVRVLSPGSDVAPAGTGFLGVGYRFGPSEVILEAAYQYMGQAFDVDEELAGWTMVVGYRLGSFNVSEP